MVAASHLAAAWLWGAEQVKGGALEVTAFAGRRPQIPGFTVHRSRMDADRAITSHLSLPVVVPALTVVQLADTHHPHLVKSVANDLVKRHWTNFRAILEWIDIVGDRRREPLRRLCLQAIEVGGHDDSPAARLLGQALIRAGLGSFATDYPVETPEGLLLVDLAWPSVKLGVEYNGGRDHDGTLARRDDTRRRNRLVAAGWRVLDADRGMTHDDIIRWVTSAMAAARCG